jgi:two-component system, chemotaxis family, response regulator Rcp1
MEIENSDVINILLVEDNPADVRLTQEAMRDSKLLNRLTVVPDGVEAIAYLKREREYANATRPDLILLDLNLPKKDGREVLAEIKADENLKSIPVVVLTTSDAHTDIVKSYDLHANCYISKPVELEKFLSIVRVIENFWFGIVKLPTLKTQDAS